MPLPPHFKYIIPGAVLTAEGGGVLALGIGFYVLTKLVHSAPSIIVMMYSLCIIIGIISVGMGLPLLITGVVKRNKAGFESKPRQKAYSTGDII